MTVANAVVHAALPQVKTQAVHGFCDFGAQKRIYCFLLVDTFFQLFWFDRKDLPDLSEAVDAESLMMLARAGSIVVAGSSNMSPVFQGDTFELTEEFLESWKQCTINVMEYI
jgi:hypothetical protein